MTDFEANQKRLKRVEERIKTRIPKHRRWDEISWVVGYVDSHGAVHGEIVFLFQDTPTHGELFPNMSKYKTWRWSKSEGLQLSILCSTRPSNDDMDSIYNWLYKNGVLHDWELTYFED